MKIFTYKLERELQQHIVENFDLYFNFDLTYTEFSFMNKNKTGRAAHRIDMIGEDKENLYVIELKRDIVDSTTIEQVRAYMALKGLKNISNGKRIKGIAAAPEVEKNLNIVNDDIEVLKLEGVKYEPNVLHSVLLPKEIVKKIEQEAKEEQRSRNNQIAKILIDHYNNK